MKPHPFYERTNKRRKGRFLEHTCSFCEAPLLETRAEQDIASRCADTLTLLASTRYCAKD